MIKYNIVAALLVLGLFARCSSNGENMKTKNVESFPVTSLLTKKADLHRLYVGDLNAIQNVEIRARVQGYLEKNYVDEGKEVKKDQVLFQLSNEEYEAQLTDAQASLKKAIAEAKASALELDRIKLLVQKNVVSPTELELAVANLDAYNASIERAKSNIEKAKTKLSYTSIRAPFDGIVDRIPFKIGSLINEGDLLTTVSDVSSISAYFNISEKDYLEYVKNKKVEKQEGPNAVRLILADGSEYSQYGKLEKIDGAFQENTGTMSFRASFPNPQKVLKHGSSGTIKLTNHIDNALLVPQKSTFEVQDKVYVFILEDSNKVKMKNFIPKIRFKDYYIVESGLRTGDKIIYEGIQKVKDGMQVHPNFVTLDSLTSITTLNQFIK